MFVRYKRERFGYLNDVQFSSCTLHRNIMSSCCASGDGIPGVTFSVIPETLESPYKDLFPAFENKGLLRTEPGGFVCHQNFAENCHKIYNMKVRSDDVWIRTFPRSGTTWTSELVWLIMNDCDFEGAAKVGLPIRAPSLDANYVNHWDKFAAESAFDTMDFITNDQIEKMPSPRVLKCHLPFYLLPPNLLDTAKVIYVARNPKDAIVSLFYFHKLVNLCTYTGDLEQFVDFFLENKVLWTPYFGTVLDAWGKRSHPNLLILFYEDMKKDIRAQIKRISTFLNKPVTEEQIEKLVDHVRVDKFSKNESVNYAKEIKAGVGKDDPTNTFVRKGQTGDWKNHFSPEVNRKIDAWIEKNLKGTGLKFVTELKDQ